MAGLPVVHGSAIRGVLPGRSLTRSVQAAAAAQAAAAQQATFRTVEATPVDPAAPAVRVRRRDEAAALVLMLARDEVGAAEREPIPAAQAQAASLAYRRQGALPLLYGDEPVIFRLQL